MRRQVPPMHAGSIVVQICAVEELATRVVGTLGSALASRL
jgi:hypothetical protein